MVKSFFFPFSDQWRLRSSCSIAVGSGYCYPDLFHLLPTRTESTSPFLPLRSCWLEIWCFTSHNQSTKSLISQYHPATNGAGSRRCPALYGAQWNQEIWAQLGCERNQKLILQPVNPVSWWAGILHFAACSGAGRVSGRTSYKPDFQLSRDSCYLCFLVGFFFFASRKA